MFRELSRQFYILFVFTLELSFVKINAGFIFTKDISPFIGSHKTSALPRRILRDIAFDVLEETSCS